MILAVPRPGDVTECPACGRRAVHARLLALCDGCGRRVSLMERGAQRLRLVHRLLGRRPARPARAGA